ncbi:tyrosyl-DNA phosphodiesterase 2 [Podarcis lilfordi]|uniref:Tyrosyl-DNA phosphodiesterase 2 n=1 Tax=Podarcis lilfordi TaxID=74358 RepID=A0AA35PCP0_9SAUR|nr:tyrosyl-DNA phosphodiesterase 2 [Podarcis lilfordi]
MDVGSVAQGVEQATPEQRTPEQQLQPSKEEEEKEEEKRRKLLCLEFASISGSDLAVAQCYLAENDWDMQRALNSYFEPPLEEQPMDAMPEPLPLEGTLIDLTDDLTAGKVSPAVKEAGLSPKEDDSTFSLITWNIDGLDLKNLQDRARGVCSYLALYSPDVVFLQEVIPPVLSYLQKRAVSYTIIPGNTDGYFTAIMLKKSRVRVLKEEITPFPTTSMMRNLLAVHVSEFLHLFIFCSKGPPYTLPRLVPRRGHFGAANAAKTTWEAAVTSYRSLQPQQVL